AATRTIRLATGVCLVTERDPILMAKQVASLDVLSGGRVMLGIGAGWNVEEMANHGTRYALRWPILRERVLAVRRIWSAEAAEVRGGGGRLRSDLAASEAGASRRSADLARCRLEVERGARRGILRRLDADLPRCAAARSGRWNGLCGRHRGSSASVARRGPER